MKTFAPVIRLFIVYKTVFASPALRFLLLREEPVDFTPKETSSDGETFFSLKS